MFILCMKNQPIECTGTRCGAVFAKHSTMPPLAYVFEWQHPHVLPNSCKVTPTTTPTPMDPKLDEQGT